MASPDDLKRILAGGLDRLDTPKTALAWVKTEVRSLGLISGVSAKQAAGQLVILDTAGASGKTKDLKKALEGFGWGSALVIDGAEVNEPFARAARNIPMFDVLPSQGANVYDIL